MVFLIVRNCQATGNRIRRVAFNNKSKIFETGVKFLRSEPNC